MKKLTSLMIFLAIVEFTWGQPEIVRSTFDKYNGRKGFITITFTGDMLKMATEMQEINLDTALKSRIDQIKILLYEDTLARQNVNLYDEVYNKIDKSYYKEMMTVTEESSNIALLAVESNGRMSEFILVGGGARNNIIVYGLGDILLDEAMKVMGNYFHDKVTGFIKHDKGQ
jgi:hypothetical protein